jgi:flavin reductase (DIM6/NTAB) family NADH-FMN oxidoreductase RutF
VDQRIIHRLFYPQVPLVLCARAEERVSAMLVVSYASASEKPPFVAVSCSPLAFTCKLALKAGAFSLCALDRKELGSVELLASISGEKVKDKLEAAGIPYALGEALHTPIIASSVASLECSIESKRKLGDHVLIIGEVKGCDAAEGFSDFWDFAKYRPILYTGWKNGMSTYAEGPDPSGVRRAQTRT